MKLVMGMIMIEGTRKEVEAALSYPEITALLELQRSAFGGGQRNQLEDIAQKFYTVMKEPEGEQ
jgi:hypothetical protein